MSSPFTAAGSSLMAALDTFAGEAVTYKRPSTGQTVNLAATPGQTEHETIDRDGFASQVKSKDWTFPAGQLKLDGVNVAEPAGGDEIRWTDDNGTTHVFRVLPFGTQRVEWRWSDAGQTRRRVHTKETGTE